MAQQEATWLRTPANGETGCGVTGLKYPTLDRWFRPSGRFLECAQLRRGDTCRGFSFLDVLRIEQVYPRGRGIHADDTPGAGRTGNAMQR